MKAIQASLLCQTVTRWMSSYDPRNSHNKARFTVRKIGAYSIIVTLVASGTLLWIEIQSIRGRLSSSPQLSVFDLDKSSNPYIYIQDRQRDLRAKSQDIRKKYLDPEKLKQESWFPWLQSYSQDPWTLLKLTKSADRKTRWLGVKAIAEMEDWEDYQYRYIAQACDGHTLVGLARSPDVGDRFFLPQPKLVPLKRSCAAELRSLLLSLPLENIGECVEYFTSLALEKGQVQEDKSVLWSFGNPSYDTNQTDRPVPEEIQHLYYLEALESHSQSKAQCVQIVQEEGLTALLHLVKELPSNSTLHIPHLVTQIIGNLSLWDCLHEEIIRTGWVPILSQWMSHKDLMLSQLAGRALLNLDRDSSDCVCEEGVYVIHPTHRTSEDPYCDVVFVHGIMGGPFKTWRQKDVKDQDQSETQQSMCWPKDWLARDCPNTRLLTVEYDTHVSEWYVRCPHNRESRTVEMRGRSLMEKLHKAGVGSRPVIWVGHSMGGLLVKQMLTMAQEDPRFQPLATQTRGLVFYSVPHRGSTLADTTSQARYLIYPSVEVQELSADSPHLKVLHDKFLTFMKDNSVPCISFGETSKTSLGKNLPKVHIVPPESSNPDVGEFYTFSENHINICKPADPTSNLYVLLLKLVRNCVLQSKVEGFLKAGISFSEIRD
ncbi:protein SERAC1-like [Haliotis rubra]|uniref:protein SERAC1-like n=1 Tax=Haliotis rubra TaxID=36100 RepID=UPI001EE57906|nr:protein SERAC1-like [Haliotis rubra]